MEGQMEDKTSGERPFEQGLSEGELIRACQKGRRSAFEPLVRQYGPLAYRFAVGMVRDAEETKDLSQEAFIRALRAINRFDPQRPFHPWFYRIRLTSFLGRPSPGNARRRSRRVSWSSRR
jgi:RNA polymerase sigma-70 factor (ECF subfamily)